MFKQLFYFLKWYYHFFIDGLLKGNYALIKTRFAYKKLKIIAITGTDGKTTSSTMLYHLLKNAGKKVALISTVAAYINEQEIETGLHVTSPSSSDLHQLISKMVVQNVKYLVLEFTSHGSYQSRLWGITPAIVGVTNVNHEHFDYHLNYDNYLNAKLLTIKKSKTVILNKDDQSYSKIKKRLSKKQLVITYGKDIALPNTIQKAIKERFFETYNQSNAKLVATIAIRLKIPHTIIAHSIKNFAGVVGRMQYLKNNRSLNIIIDFAHTPQGIEAILSSLKKKISKSQKPTSKLIAVFGAAGLRDRLKRPIMGKIASEYADYIVLTAEDPRTENIWSIIHQIKSGIIDQHGKIVSIADRQQAINFAINNLAKKDDYVVVLGKGPEKSLCLGTTEYPWSDYQAIQTALKQKTRI